MIMNDYGGIGRVKYLKYLASSFFTVTITCLSAVYNAVVLSPGAIFTVESQ